MGVLLSLLAVEVEMLRGIRARAACPGAYSTACSASAGSSTAEATQHVLGQLGEDDAGVSVSLSEEPLHFDFGEDHEHDTAKT